MSVNESICVDPHYFEIHFGYGEDDYRMADAIIECKICGQSFSIVEDLDAHFKIHKMIIRSEDLSKPEGDHPKDQLIYVLEFDRVQGFLTINGTADLTAVDDSMIKLQIASGTEIDIGPNVYISPEIEIEKGPPGDDNAPRVISEEMTILVHPNASVWMSITPKHDIDSITIVRLSLARGMEADFGIGKIPSERPSEGDFEFLWKFVSPPE